MQAKLGTEVENNDAFIIEFAINDYGLCRPETWPFYCSAVEGLVREILRRNNHAKIFSILLGRRSPETAAISRQVLEFSQSLSDHYGVHTVPVDSRLKETLAEADFKAAFSDDLHYKRPIAIGIVGKFVGDTIAAVLQSAPPPRFDAPALSGDTFEGSVATSALDLLERPAIVFENSRYVERAVEIFAGETVKVSVPGRLLLARFVSCANSCRVRVTESGKKTMTFDSARPEREGDKFPFLIRSAPFFRRDWATIPKAKMNELTIEVLPPEGAASGSLVRPAALSSVKSDAPAFYLSSLLVL